MVTVRARLATQIQQMVSALTDPPCASAAQHHPSRRSPRALSSEQAAFVRSLDSVPTSQNDAVDGSPDHLIATSTDHSADVATDRLGNESTGRPVTEPRTAKRPKSTRSGRALFTRANGDAVRKLSFYFAPELAKHLHLHCVRHDRDMSAFVSDVVRRALARSNP